MIYIRRYVVIKYIKEPVKPYFIRVFGDTPNITPNITPNRQALCFKVQTAAPSAPEVQKIGLMVQ